LEGIPLDLTDPVIKLFSQTPLSNLTDIYLGVFPTLPGISDPLFWSQLGQLLTRLAKLQRVTVILHVKPRGYKFVYEIDMIYERLLAVLQGRGILVSVDKRTN
jgi:hypothetical protein